MGARSHSGQALVILLAFVASLVGGFLVVFSVGQTVNDKMKLQNAADAAAYSAAIWQARSLNYQAYLNRAIVANEVAIAQLVSLRSWSAYMGQTTRNVSRVASFVPPLAAPMRALAQGWTSVDRGIQASVSPLEGGLSRWNVDVLSMAQAIAHQQAPIAAADLVDAGGTGQRSALRGHGGNATASGPQCLAVAEPLHGAVPAGRGRSEPVH